MKRIDAALTRRFRMPSLLLMENAGRGVAEAARAIRRGGEPVTVLAGSGNNGGDGLVAARHLHRMGIPCRALLAKPFSALSGDSRTNLEILRRLKIPCEAFSRKRQGRWETLCRRSSALIDALLGTGARGKVREPYATLIRLVNRSGRPVISVDLPSGLDADTGRPNEPAVRATVTVTAGLPKTGLFAGSARPFVGRLRIADLGISLRMFTKGG